MAIPYCYGVCLAEDVLGRVRRLASSKIFRWYAERSNGYKLRILS